MDAPTGNKLNEICKELGLTWKYEHSLIKVEMSNSPSKALELLKLFRDPSLPKQGSFNLRYMRLMAVNGTLKAHFCRYFYGQFGESLLTPPAGPE
jgi:hypothetical protein